MEVEIHHKSSYSEVNVRGAQLLVRGKLQIYVCHDGSLEVYVDGKDIKERLGINVSSMWFDFGDAALTVEKNPGDETETRPKDFRKEVKEGDSPYWGESPLHDAVVGVFGVPASALEPKNQTFIEKEPEVDLPF